jgi:CheY-like chemotaxis protein
MTTVLQRAQKLTTAVDPGPRVLIVDDDAVVRMLLEDICVEPGWKATVAATSDEAVLAAGLQHIDLVLLDLNLGGSDDDRLDTPRAIRMMCRATPIVVVTGQSPEPSSNPLPERAGRLYSVNQAQSRKSPRCCKGIIPRQSARRRDDRRLKPRRSARNQVMATYSTPRRSLYFSPCSLGAPH